MDDSKRSRMYVQRPWWFYWLPVLVAVFAVLAGATGHFAAQSQDEKRFLETRIEAQERVAFEQCRSDNDTRKLIGEVLDVIASMPREDETLMQQRDRERAFEEAKGILILHECPIAPEELDIPD